MKTKEECIEKFSNRVFKVDNFGDVIINPSVFKSMISAVGLNEVKIKGRKPFDLWQDYYGMCHLEIVYFKYSV